jgi:hypothetical protein
MAVKIEEFVAHLGWEVDPKGLDSFKSSVSGVVDLFKKVAVAVAGATTALTAFAVVTNKQTSINARLAESTDMSAESLENWTFLLGAIDFNADKVIRTVKTLNDRIGQAASGIGDAATVKDATKALRIEFDELKKQAPEEQFKTILQASKELEDGQIAAAAATQLLGRQGAFLTGFLRDQKGTVEELLIEQAKYNLLTEENREQAKRFVGLWDNFNAVIDSSKAAFAAFLGEALSPLLEEFLEWVKLNREMIKLKIAEWAERAGKFLEVVFRIVQRMVVWVDRLADAFGGLQNIIAFLAGAGIGLFVVRMVRMFQTLVPLVWGAVKAYGAWNLVTKAGKLMGVVGLLVLMGLALNSLVRFFQGRDSLVGDIGEAIAEQMDIGLQALADFFGFSKDEFNLWLVNIVGGVEAAFSRAFEVVVGFFEEAMNIRSYDQVLDAWQAAFSMLINSIQDMFKGLVAWLLDFVPSNVMKMLQNLISMATNFAKKIPFVGDAIGDTTVQLAGAVGKVPALQKTAQASTFNPLSRQSPSPAAIQGAIQNRNVQNIANTSKKGGDLTFNVDMPVTQRKGESGVEFGNRVVAVLETQVAAAIRDNDTGIVK